MENDRVSAKRARARLNANAVDLQIDDLQIDNITCMLSDHALPVHPRVSMFFCSALFAAISGNKHNA